MMKIFVLCVLGVALYNLGFYFGYSSGYEQRKEEEVSEWADRQMQALRRQFVERSTDED